MTSRWSATSPKAEGPSVFKARLFRLEVQLKARLLRPAKKRARLLRVPVSEDVGILRCSGLPYDHHRQAPIRR